MTHPPASPTLPALYRLVFLYIEPLSTFAGAVYAHCLQQTYLAQTHPASAPAPGQSVPIASQIVLSQLANLYLLLCISEALVLRSTADRKVWNTFLFGLFVADLGHLYAVRPAGAWVYWRFWDWNATDGGNVGFVYFLIVTRLLFFAGVGIPNGAKTLKTT
ncbi:hypothetical protein BS50DRAFT_572719 [Corynespora cassiicola Philippines]|uniref:DUF7704 domain-containing protein n=1 Tax=Corynespora cassiicola Philippines TaxID=1448308 RepID=A0A2T2NQK4_CORCC|nr:hypothetical protein BS50DRAFT_572719 [Corynespora cassiicola Philippines]